MGQAFLHGNGGVANGCTLTVNAPAGVTVTITKGSKTKTKTADSSGYATFKGLEQGEWTVTISSGSQTAKKTVYIVTEYDAAITFFSAAINVSYPAGSILTCTDGSTTLTAGDTAGGWYFTIPNAGNWTVTATSGSNSASQTVSITADGQAEQVVLSYWDGALYDSGDEYGDITGGWTTEGYTYYGGNLTAGINTGGKITLNGEGAVLGTNVMIDLSAYSTLKVDVTYAGNGGQVHIASSKDVRDGTAALAYCIFSSNTEQTVDISNINTSAYIVLLAHHGGCAVTKVWLE